MCNIVVLCCFDIHGTLLCFSKTFKFLYKKEWFRKMSDYFSNSTLLVALFTLFLIKNKKIVESMQRFHDSSFYKVCLLTNSYKNSKWILNFILRRIKRINCFDDIICRDYIFETEIEHKIKKIRKYDIRLIFDDNPDIVNAIKETNCKSISYIT